MDFIRKSKGTFLVLAGVASIAGKKKVETPKPKQELPKMTEKKRKDIFGTLKAEYDEVNNVLTLESVLSILNGVLELTIPDHAELIVKHRKDRREKYDDLNGYIELYRQYLDSVFQMEMKARAEILAYLNVEQPMWGQSEAFYTQMQHPGILDFNRSYYPRIKISIGPTLKLDAEELTHCLIDAKNNVIHEADAMKNILRSGSQYSFIRDVTETRAYDMLYFMSDMEEEDIIQNLEDNASHPELRDLHAAFEQNIENLNRISSMLM